MSAFTVRIVDDNVYQGDFLECAPKGSMALESEIMTFGIVGNELLYGAYALWPLA